MNILRQISRLLLGALFVFSGFVKSVDPLGTANKIGDYFKAVGLSVPDDLGTILAVALCATELFIGLALLFRVRTKEVSWLSLAFMVGFTIITLLLAITDAVSDCGCFGDAYKLTNWQTFYKNLIILPFAIIVFWQKKKYSNGMPQYASWGFAVLLFAVSIWFNIFNLNNLPLINYRPYTIGQNIWMGMQIPANAPADVYETKLIYEKDGVKKEFTENNFPWQDTTWVFVDQKSTLIKKGYQPPIHDFSILSPTDGDITEEVLKQKGTQFFLISPNLSKANIEEAKKANALYVACQNASIPFVCLTSSIGEQVEKFRSETGALYPIYATDETTLKTAMRSNPGLMMLYDGTIVGLWSGKNLPSPAFIKGNTLGKQLMTLEYRTSGVIVTMLILALALFGALMFFVRNGMSIHRN